MTDILSTHGVQVTFGGLKALDDVSISVAEGVSCGIIGPNGSGKTTLLGVLSRLTRLSAGTITFDGGSYEALTTAEAARLGIARTFQTVRLLPKLSVIKNVMVGAAAKSMVRTPASNFFRIRRALSEERLAHAVAEAALERVGVLEVRDSYPNELPYGLQRRVEIARALATKPKLLLLDEPMAGMNSLERSDVASILLDLKREGLTQILVEHDLPMIYKICDTAFALDFGHVISSGPPLEVAEDPKVREAYLGAKAAREERS
jgi:ABC-type branched-subunit amino acid transport system ATPase component